MSGGSVYFTNPLSALYCYQSLVLSMQHLASFLTAVRTRVANKAVASLHQKVLSTKNLASSAENAAHEAVDAARAAQMTARHASAEAMSATAGVAAATAAARHEGSVLLEEASALYTNHHQNGFPKPAAGVFLACPFPPAVFGAVLTLLFRRRRR